MARVNWNKVVTVALLCVILGSVGVIVGKSRHNGFVLWAMACEDRIDRVAPKPLEWEDIRREIREGADRLRWFVARAIPDRNDKPKGKQMPTSYYVGQRDGVGTDPGDATCKGLFNQTGTWGDDPTFTNGTVWLWRLSGPEDNGWVISAAVGDSTVFSTVAYCNPSAGATPDSGTWYVGNGTAPAPTVSEQPAQVRLGTSEADAAKWDDAANHRFSKYGLIGGYKNVDADTTDETAPASIQYLTAATTGTFRALLKLGGHTWATITGLPATSGEWSPAQFAEGLPFSDGVDAWATWLGAAGAKDLALELRSEADDSLVASDAAAYTMFVPTVRVVSPAPGAVSDRFDAEIGWEECHAGGSGTAELQAVVGEDVYALSNGEYGLTCQLPNDDTATVTVAVDLNLAGIGAGLSFSPAAGDNGLPPGAFAFRVDPESPPLANCDVALSHVETYTVQITAPTSGAVLPSGAEVSLTAYLSQGWMAGSWLRVSALRSGVWHLLLNSDILPSAYYIYGGEFTLGPASRIRYLPISALTTADTALRVEWGYLSGGDFVVLDDDTVTISVEADGGLDGGNGEGLPEPPFPDNPPGPDPVYPPWVRWLLPPSGSTVLPQFTARLDYGNFAETAAGHLTISAVGGGISVSLHDAAQVLGTSGLLTLPLDFGASADGAYTILITLTGANGQSATTQATLTLSAAGSADVTAPVVTITAPADGATINGETTLAATATDAGGVWRLTWFVDGVRWGYSFAPANATSYNATFALDTTLLLNGAHTISVVARDVSGNVSDADAITVNVTNAQADLTRYLYFVPLGRDQAGNLLNALSARWRNQEKTRTIELSLLPSVAGLPATQIYNLYHGFDNGQANPPAWGGMTLFDPLHSHAIPASKVVRYGLCAVPAQTSAYFDITCTSLKRLTTLENGDPLLLCLTPHSLQRLFLSSGAIGQFADLSSLADTPADVAAVGGKVYVAHGSKVLIIDADTGELTDDLDVDSLTSKTAVTALATDGQALFVAVTLAAGGSRVYRYVPEATTVYASHDHAIATLAYLGGSLYAGNSEGEVLAVTASGATVVCATGQGSVARLGANGSVVYAGTGSAGKLFGKLGSWAEQWDSGFTLLSGIGSYNGHTWAGGSGTGARYLWYERTAGVWAQGFDTDSLVTEVNDLLTLNTGGHEQLYIAATRSGGTCRLYRLELAAPSAYQCGVNVPPFAGKAVR